MANPEHLAKLKEGVEAWNKWRKENPCVKPDLKQADLSSANLFEANLSQAKLSIANLSGADLSSANLFKATMYKANLFKAKLIRADLSSANLFEANLSQAELSTANLSGAGLNLADLSGVEIWHTDLTGAILTDVNLTGAKLNLIDLRWATLVEAKLRGARIMGAKLQGARFERGEVDGSTMIWQCHVDQYRAEGKKYTNFEGVGLGDIRIDPPTRQLLEYNIRRANWNRWFQGKAGGELTPPLKGWRKRGWLFMTSPIRVFWGLSDYGHSTWQIIKWFFILSFLFAAVYANLAYWAPPGAVHDLAVEKQGTLWHYFWLVMVRPIYFSVVTMTTLGFGDMHAEKGSFLGHVLLTIQVLLGYVMLGALVTRFAVMFTGGGPAGNFAPTEEPPKPTEKQPQMYPLWQIMGYFWL